MKRQRTYFGDIWLAMMKLLLIMVALFLLIALFFSVPLYYQKWRLRDARPRALNQTMKQGEQVITAIQKFTASEGKPPPDLNALIPVYLKTLPETGPMAKDGWHYEISEKPDAGGWVLKVKVPQSMTTNTWGFGDYFVYHPSEKYERYDYGGVLERVGKWGYYYE